MRRLTLLLACALLATRPAAAQRVQGSNGPQDATPIRCVNIAGTAFEACGGGGGGSGTTDIDDGNVAGGQTVGLGITESYAWDGAAWRRVTFGQTTMASSLPVTLASDQSAIPVSGTFWQATQPVSGTVAATQSGAWNIGTLATITNPVAVTGTFFQATQPVSGTVTANQGTANATPWNENLAQVGGTAVSALTGTAPVGTEAGVPVRPITSQRKATAALTVACTAANINACTAGSTLELVLDGYVSGSFAFSNAAMAGVMAVDYSFDGSKWTTAVAYASGTLGTALVPASGKDVQVAFAAGTTDWQMFPTSPAGITRIRARLQSFSAGVTITATGYANTTSDPFAVGAASFQPAGRATTTVLPQLAGFADGTAGCVFSGTTAFPCIQPFEGRNAAIANTERGLVVRSIETPSTLAVTATAAVATAATATLNAVVGQFHYITNIQIQKLYSIVGVAAGAGVICTSTNLPGTPTWTTEQLASPAGTVVTVVNMAFAQPLKSSVANTNTTVTCPLQTQTIWRINVTYNTGS